MNLEDFKPTIIVTSFNHKAYLEEAVETVVSQTLMPYEILLADDGSTDGSADLIRDYEQKYKGLVKGVFQKGNIGIPRNRNEALKCVTGNYVGILDGDDLFVEDKLELQFKKLQQMPSAQAVYGNFELFNENNQAVRLKWNEKQAEGQVLDTVAKFQTGILRTLLVKHDLVQRAGYMDIQLPRYDGLWLTIQLAALCDFFYVDEVLVKKRDHVNSDSKTIDQAGHMHDLKRLFENLQPLLSSQVGEARHREINKFWYARFPDLKL